MRDLRSSRLMTFKAVCFLLIGILGSALLILESPTLRTAILLLLVIWAFARAYYFAFYVIEHYIDPSYRFAGLTSVVRYFLTRPRR